MLLKKVKKWIVEKKANCQLNCKIKWMDVMLFMGKAWSESFERVEQNKRAIAERGWPSLNCVLLDHPVLKKQADKNGVLQAYEQLSLTGDVIWIPMA